PQERIDMRLCERDAALLRGNETLFHRVGNPNRHREVDDARGPLQRVGGAHTGFEVLGSVRLALELQQTGYQDLCLALRLQAKEIHHRESAEVVTAHASLRLIVENNSSASRMPTDRSRQVTSCVENVLEALAIVTGSSFKSPGANRCTPCT